jgi:two-component system response regulator TtrR
MAALPNATDGRKGLVYVIDDDDAIRDSLAFLLEGGGMEVETYACAADFLANYRPAPPCCLVLDIRMPGMSGMELQDRLIAQGERIPIIFITGHGDVPMAVQAVKKGAVDFIEKPFNDQQLIDLIGRALQHEQTVQIGRQAEVRATARLELLTPREREVLDLVVAGKLNKTIADQLGISIKTVETHRSKVMEKMQAKSLADLIQSALAARGTTPTGDTA